jgi:hypothetical protein
MLLCSIVYDIFNYYGQPVLGTGSVVMNNVKIDKD